MYRGGVQDLGYLSLCDSKTLIILMQFNFFAQKVFEKLYELYCFQIFW